MWYFTSPEQVIYGEDALSQIAHLQGTRAFIVSDATLRDLGLVEQIAQLFKDAGFATAVFAEVEPEPSLQTARKGAQVAAAFEPDWIVALGGGSPMDAAKAIWVLYERPDLDPTDINPMEPLGLHKCKLMAIPTTSGTGSEGTWALVLTDTEEQRKFSTGSHEIIPTIALVDPILTKNLPARITADTGMDALTHAVEGYASTWHNDFSDGLCLHATRLVLSYLERAVTNGAADEEARERMANAATLAGLGFGNANLGLAHAMGHSLGALFKQPHGRSVGLFLPYVMEYTINHGAGRYLDLARHAGLTDSHDEEEGGRVLAVHIRALMERIGQPLSIAALGIARPDFQAKMETLCDYSEMDTQFFTAPHIPETEEMQQIFEYAYDGKVVDF